jgi:hypothetical protein
MSDQMSRKDRRKAERAAYDKARALCNAAMNKSKPYEDRMQASLETMVVLRESGLMMHGHYCNDGVINIYRDLLEVSKDFGLEEECAMRSTIAAVDRDMHREERELEKKRAIQEMVTRRSSGGHHRGVPKQGEE